MLDFSKLLIHAPAAPLRRQAQLEARLSPADRQLFVWLCRLFPSLRSAVTIVQPDTVVPFENYIRQYW